MEDAVKEARLKTRRKIAGKLSGLLANWDLLVAEGAEGTDPCAEAKKTLETLLNDLDDEKTEM